MLATISLVRADWPTRRRSAACWRCARRAQEAGRDGHGCHDDREGGRPQAQVEGEQRDAEHHHGHDAHHREGHEHAGLERRALDRCSPGRDIADSQVVDVRHGDAQRVPHEAGGARGAQAHGEPREDAVLEPAQEAGEERRGRQADDDRQRPLGRAGDQVLVEKGLDEQRDGQARDESDDPGDADEHERGGPGTDEPVQDSAVAGPGAHLTMCCRGADSDTITATSASVPNETAVGGPSPVVQR